jgi:hypothetical protein
LQVVFRAERQLISYRKYGSSLYSWRAGVVG